MLLIDTNVISEVMLEHSAEQAVADWFRARLANELFTTTISYGEIAFGIRRLAAGAKRQVLEQAADTLFAVTFKDRVLPFDLRAADMYADLRILRARLGTPLASADGMIAAIARVHGATTVTRDLQGFGNCGLDVVDPWKAT